MFPHLLASFGPSLANCRDAEREVVVLRYIADFSEAEIASVLGISRSTVSSTLADAHRRLGSLLDEGEDE